MRKLATVLALCLFAVSAPCQSTSKWQIAMITDVKSHQAAEGSSSDPPSYDVSVKVGDTLYVVLYRKPSGEVPPKYEIGHELLVLVGKNTITYNDIMGQSLQVPIESQRSATESKHLK